jgi:hypothetical protein
VAINSTFKVDKWDNRVRNPAPCIYNAMSQPSELNSRDASIFILLQHKSDTNVNYSYFPSNISAYGDEVA